MNQAERIREIAKDLLKSRDSRMEKIIVNGNKIEGIKYSELKKYFMDNNKDKFTEGAITGALQTLTDRVEYIHKTKTKNGVFFFYSEEESIDSDDKKKTITESQDYLKLEEKVNGIIVSVGDILRNASKGQYSTTSELDISYLRKILSASEHLEDVLRDYKKEDAFEKIQNQTYLDRSDQSDHIMSPDDLPF